VYGGKNQQGIDAATRYRRGRPSKFSEECLAIADETEGDVILAPGEDGKAVACPRR